MGKSISGLRAPGTDYACTVTEGDFRSCPTIASYGSVQANEHGMIPSLVEGLVLGIDPDDRLPTCHKPLFLPVTLATREVAFWVRRPRLCLLGLGVRGIRVLVQQPPYGGGTDPRADLGPPRTQRPHAASQPCVRTPRVPRRRRGQQLAQRRVRSSGLFSASPSPALACGQTPQAPAD
jgi:hypothetical protein